MIADRASIAWPGPALAFLDYGRWSFGRSGYGEAWTMGERQRGPRIVGPHPRGGHLLGALVVGIVVGVVMMRDPGLTVGLRSMRAIADYCPCNQAMKEIDPGLDLATLEELVGERLRALDEQGRLRPAVEALGEDRVLWLGKRVFVDCRRPDELHARRGVIRSYVIELDGAGRVREVRAERMAFYGCDGDVEDAEAAGGELRAQGG